jgi:hypothetical protein
MANQRLINQIALMITEDCLGLLVNVLDEEQKLQARDGLFEICVAGLESYALQADRMRQRLHPLDN